MNTRKHLDLSSEDIIKIINHLEVTRAIPNCYACGLPESVCACEAIEGLKVKHMNVHLHVLMHEGELGRKTNTARLAAFIMRPWTTLYIWSRTAPPGPLLELINAGDVDTCLLYPAKENDKIFELDRFVKNSEICRDSSDKEGVKTPHIIIIDGTWQEAQKILNKSPYLQDVPRLEIHANGPSQFTLRRNQKPGHLCTSEAISKALKALHEVEAGEKLETLTSLFLKNYEIGRSGHRLK